MTQQDFIQFGPLLLAAYESFATILFFGCIRRFVATQAQFAWIRFAWSLSIFLPPVLLVRLYAVALGLSYEQFYNGEISSDQTSHLLTFFFLGFIMPVNGVFGFVASEFPDLWERYSTFARRAKESR